MIKNNSLLRKLDLFTFKQVDQLESDSNFQKLSKVISGLPEQEQKYIIQFTNIMIILLPLIIASGFFFYNYQKRNELELKENIVKTIDLINIKELQSSRLKNRYLSNTPFRNEQTIKKKLSSLVNDSKANFQIKKFEILNPTSTIAQVNSQIGFKDLTIANLKNLLNGLSIVSKAKIRDLKITKNKSKNLLAGDLEIIQYGKVQ